MRCSVCNISLEKKSRSAYINQNSTYYCRKCYKKNSKGATVNLNVPQEAREPQNSNESEEVIEPEDTKDFIFLPIVRGHLAHCECIFNCKKSKILDP